MLCDDDMLLFRGSKSPTHMSEIRSNPVQSAGKGCSCVSHGNTVKTSMSGDSGRWHLFHVLIGEEHGAQCPNPGRNSP